MPRQPHPPPGVEQRGEADQQHGDPGPVVVVLGPGDVLGVARRRRTLARRVGARARFRLRAAPTLVEPRLQRRNGEVRVVGAGQARQARRVTLHDLGPRDVVVRQVHGGRERGERGGDGQHHDADRDLALDEAPYTLQLRAAAGPVSGEAVQQRKVAHAERQQDGQHRTLRGGHGTIGGAVEGLRPSKVPAPEAKDPHTDKHHARRGLARVSPSHSPRERGREAQRLEEGCQPAEPQRRSGLVQQRRGEQRRPGLRAGDGVAVADGGRRQRQRGGAERGTAPRSGGRAGRGQRGDRQRGQRHARSDPYEAGAQRHADGRLQRRREGHGLQRGRRESRRERGSGGRQHPMARQGQQPRSLGAFRLARKRRGDKDEERDAPPHG